MAIKISSATHDVLIRYPSQASQQAAIAGYIRWKNKRVRPKRHSTIDSKIRRPDYLPNVA